MGEKWYKCLECGDVFPTKTPHTHGKQYRKHKIPWEKVEMPKSYAALEEEVGQLRAALKRICDHHCPCLLDCEPCYIDIAREALKPDRKEKT